MRTAVLDIPLPCIVQEEEYTCGPAALRAVLAYWGPLPIPSENELAALLGTTPNFGTDHQNIIRLADIQGFCVAAKYQMTHEDLKAAIAAGKTVIISIQAWEDDPGRFVDDGHYVTAVGFDNDCLYFQDPSLDNARGYLTWDQLDNRWWDIDSDFRYERLGIVIWKDTKPLGAKSLVSNAFDITTYQD